MLHFMITVRIPLLHPVVLMYSSTRIQSRGLASCTRSSVYAAAPTQYYRHCLVYTSCIVAWGNGRVSEPVSASSSSKHSYNSDTG